MLKPRVLTLTTDFGPDGPYVAALKGVVLGLAPDTQIVDVTHRVTPQNVLEGAFILSSILDAFPPETVHLAVVDPGVGTDRRLAALRVDDQWVIGPDNGLVGGALTGRQPQGIWHITNPEIRRPLVSNTFHGRDLMASAAAHLLNGGNPDEFGPRLQSVVQLASFEPRECPQGWVGEVIYRDSFGNLVTNVRGDRLVRHSNKDWVIEIAGARVEGLTRTYGDRTHGNLIALIGSSGWLEVAVVNGDAGKHLAAGPGTTVLVHASD